MMKAAISSSNSAEMPAAELLTVESTTYTTTHIRHPVREQRDRQYFGHNFDEFRQLFIILTRIILAFRVTEKLQKVPSLHLLARHYMT